MIKPYTLKLLALILFAAFSGYGTAFAQYSQAKKDSIAAQKQVRPAGSRNQRLREGVLTPDPPNLVRTITYDPATNLYILTEKVGNLYYRPPQYLTFAQYLTLLEHQNQRQYFQQLSDAYAYESQQPGFIPQISVRSKTFEQIFGSSTIDIRPQGSAEMIFAGQVNSNQNPLYNTKQRSVFNFNFDQKIQMNIIGNIGDKLKIATNYNTDAQFQFENQVKLDYTGHPDEIIQKIEAGTVSMPLNTSLITGSQALFGVKTKLKFGKLDVTSIFSQQRSESKTITITNGQQQGEFRLTPADYEANKHYFLSQFFRNNYNKALANIPIINSSFTITKIEVWTTNRSNTTQDSRDILAFLDLAENRPYNTALVHAAGGTGLPAGVPNNPNFPQQSNDLLRNLPQNARLTNSNDIAVYFQSTGATDNYAKLTYARKLTDKEFTLHPQLGYISLNYPLNNDEVLAVAYRYTYNGQEYQVGEFSTDVPVDPNNPKVLYVKLLKNELLKTNLPTWDLMMKNIYSLGAYQISPSNFRMQITRLDEKSGIEKPIMDEGTRTKSKLWLQLTDLDNLNAQNDKQPDGYFDFLEGITIDSQNGRVMFPVVEPFGSDLASRFAPGETDLIGRYTYQPLYDSTKTIAQQFFPQLNRYLIKGTYSSQGGSEYQLNATNIPQGSVVVTAGSLKMVEGTDYTIDYNIGRIRIINQALLSSGQPINVRIENNELFGVQQKSLYGSRLDYRVNQNLGLGATIMHLTEQPITQKEIIGEESISNTIYGFDANYSSNSRLLTRLVDKLPLITTKVPSTVTFNGEFAQLLPGSPSALNFAGSKKGTAYLDDFENSRSIIDLKSAIAWQLSGTPQMFPESQLFDNLAYGYNRARLAFYNIDPIFYTNTSAVLKSNVRAELSNHYVRQVLQTEVFPYKQSVTGQPLILPTLDLAFYPNTRGPYNYSITGINPNGTLQNPRSRWGGMFRKLETNDFESLNVEFISFWVMDPFIYKPNSPGGDLYFNLGSISEDILKDGRKSLENGLPADGDLSKVDETSWGRVPKLQPVINAFDNNPDARRLQDVGLDGLNDVDEQKKFGQYVQQMKAQLSAQAAAAVSTDPSSDNYQYYQGPALDQANAGILQRYSRYNNTEGNSKTAEQSKAELGIETSASTSLPDGEDINRDNTMSQADQYFEYKVSMRPQDLIVGQNFITDKITSQVKLQDGTTAAVNWYQFRIPITSYQSKVGNIEDFKAIRFIRMFMTNFADTAVLRMASLQLERGEWRNYNTENSTTKVIADPALVNPPLDNSSLDVSTVNIEENGNRTPIPYVVPPGITRQRDYNNLRTDTRLNEQSLSVTVNNLRDGYSRAAYRTFYNDLRSYKHINMFIHAEGQLLRDNDISAFIRLGVDYQDNYYEYEIPLKVTPQSTRDPDAIWPAANELDLALDVLTNAKLARNNARLNGQPWPLTTPFVYMDGKNKVTIKGQPDLSRLRAIMLGVRNPYKNGSTTDDGMDKSAIVWFNELRLTDFDQRGGWAATARLNAKLADFADVTIAGSKSTVGFGAIDQSVSQRSRSDNQAYDVAANVELGKLFPDKKGIHIPMFVDVSNQTSMPQFDPAQPDIELKKTLAAAPDAKARDSIKNVSVDYTMRKSINFTNIHKVKTTAAAPNHVWDIENFNLTYAYSEYEHHDFITQSDLQKTYRAALAYNYSNQPKYYSPFQKTFKKNWMTLFRDFNFSVLPTRLNFNITFDRFYSENTLRNNDPNNYIPIPTTFNKNFLITRVYGIGWNLTKNLQMDIDATNLAVVDEPAGRVNGLKRDTLWDNLLKLGRTTNYNHTLNFNYNVPLNKIPGFDFMNVVARYSTNFNWQSQPEFALNQADYNVGNTIQNSRTIQLNPTLNMLTLYNKFSSIRKDNNKQGGGSVWVSLLTSIKNISGTYTRTEGTFLPGYLPRTNYFGQDFSYNAPGLGFLLGSQADIRAKAVANGWITTDTLQNQLYYKTLNENLNFRAVLEPFHDLRIELMALRTQDRNYQTNFKYLPGVGFSNLGAVTSGDYSVSYFSLATAFSKATGINNTSGVFQQFLNNRTIISQRLGRQNPNSTGSVTDGYADGYGSNQQNVLIPAFLAAYSGKNASSVSLNNFPNIPIPNWQITYNGLSRLPFFADLFDSFDLRHGYRSTYTVNSYNTLIQYRDVNGSSFTRDANNDFLPFYQFSQVTLFEQFVPLIGIDVRFRNSVTSTFEYRRSRTLSLSLLNSQLAQQNENILVFGFGYHTRNFKFPFGLFNNTLLKNDMNFKLDVAVRDNVTLIYRADVQQAEISSGAKNITLRPSIDYVINQRFNLSLFYDSNITKPYTSQAFNTAFTNFGINLKLLLQ
ncbi:T9SS outer membrane translocon Sov/SprA [Mucilaginibacter sp. KACC 22063]|uniref:T9SS outer membrane translocon Sov/SprA n=1 Tax=Mucilaginibacter sp. KACC 22063 TaxID=3025666 RepID=UPI0023665559|nr:cell surface protein SprA [Mucilaginibacter sp. KACC 22063]WDF55941.1 cell surface protein SprA [Mucilaginibacter sp. KACC 22063]